MDEHILLKRLAISMGCPEKELGRFVRMRSSASEETRVTIINLKTITPYKEERDEQNINTI